MGFKETAEATPDLVGKWSAGLGAFEAKDKPHVKPEDTSTGRLRGSVYIDKALLAIFPQANRWDYAIGYQHDNRSTEFIYWLETHSGNDSQISVMLRKLEWLRTWHKGDGKELAKFDKLFVWAPSGATSFTKGATQVRILADKGIFYAGSVFKIPINHAIAKAE